jgi:hypothetical protein
VLAEPLASASTTRPRTSKTNANGTGSVELVIVAASVGRKVAAPFNARKRVSLSPHRRDLSTAAVRLAKVVGDVCPPQH